MYKTILLAFDGSDEGRRALTEGAEVAQRFGARVHLLAVIRLPATLGLLDGVYPESALEQEIAAIDKVVEEGVQELRQLGLVVEGHRRFGEPVIEIAAAAEALCADLIVIGHRRLGRLRHWWQSSLGATLLDRSRVSILIAIGDEREASQDSAA